MTNQATLIINAAIVNEGTITEEDVLIKNGRIETIGVNISVPNGLQSNRCEWQITSSWLD